MDFPRIERLDPVATFVPNGSVDELKNAGSVIRNNGSFGLAAFGEERNYLFSLLDNPGLLEELEPYADEITPLAERRPLTENAVASWVNLLKYYLWERVVDEEGTRFQYAKDFRSLHRETTPREFALFKDHMADTEVFPVGLLYGRHSIFSYASVVLPTNADNLFNEYLLGYPPLKEYVKAHPMTLSNDSDTYQVYSVLSRGGNSLEAGALLAASVLSLHKDSQEKALPRLHVHMMPRGTYTGNFDRVAEGWEGKPCIDDLLYRMVKQVGTRGMLSSGVDAVARDLGMTTGHQHPYTNKLIQERLVRESEEFSRVHPLYVL